MSRNLVASSFIASALILASACDSSPPPGTTPPDDAVAKAGDGSGGDAAASDDAEGSKPAGEDLTKKVCDADVGDPTALFLDSMIIRLPKGMSEDALMEQSPWFLTLSRPIVSVGCGGEGSEAEVSWGTFGYFEDDASKDMQTYRDEALSTFYARVDKKPVEFKFSDESITGRKLEVVVDIPADETAQPQPRDERRAWFVLKAKFGRMYWVLYETTPAEWNALKNTFAESTAKLGLLNPEG
ncbi:MAG: hypothetical protein B7733_09405 [Myxococcales bacterium FL481]|nr:MAG: hypothetical protein B7733_09405 [Myxococcales bacterium FL481]